AGDAVEYSLSASTGSLVAMVCRNHFTARFLEPRIVSGSTKSNFSSLSTMASCQPLSSNPGSCQFQPLLNSAFQPACPLLMTLNDPSALVMTSTAAIGDWPGFGVCP